MSLESNLTTLCAAELTSGDTARLVAWSDGLFGIVRNNQPVGEQRWQRSDLTDCAKAFLNYVHLARKTTAKVNS